MYIYTIPGAAYGALYDMYSKTAVLLYPALYVRPLLVIIPRSYALVLVHTNHYVREYKERFGFNMILENILSFRTEWNKKTLRET